MVCPQWKNFSLQTRCQERAKTRKLFNLKSNWACPHYMHLLLLLINLPKWQVYVLNGGSHNTLQNINLPFSFQQRAFLVYLLFVRNISPCSVAAIQWYVDAIVHTCEAFYVFFFMTKNSMLNLGKDILYIYVCVCIRYIGPFVLFMQHL